MTNDKGECIYVDNPCNRRLGRAGKPIPSRKGYRKNMMEEKTFKELCLLMKNLHFTDQHNDLDYQCALTSAMDDMECEEVQEKWKAMNVDQATD